MAIYFYSYPTVQPAPGNAATPGDVYFGAQDIYITNLGAIKTGYLGSGLSAGKILLNNWDPTKPYLGQLNTTVKGNNPAPPAAIPPIVTTVDIPTVSLSTSTPSTVVPITAYGGAAIPGGTLIDINVTPALPAGLTLYKSAVNLNVSGTAPIVSGSGTVWSVTYNIANSTGNAPVVGRYYAVRGQSKVSYNGIYLCTAYTGTTITLQYNASPAGGTGTWNATDTVSMVNSGETAIANSSTGVLEWYNSWEFAIIGTPTVGSVATTYTVSFTDAYGNTGSASFSMAVAGPLALTTTQVIASNSLNVNVLATPFTPVTASGGSTPYAFSISPALPTGLSLNASTGQITGTPTVLSPSTTYTVTVTDNSGATSSKTFTLTTVAPALTTTLVNSSVTLTQSILATPFTPVTASGGSGTLTYAISPALASGLSFNTSTGQITGTPTVSLVATSFTVTVTDTVGQSSNKTFSLTINALPALNTTVLVPASNLTKNTAVSAFIPVSASGGYGTLTYSVTPALPSGLTFNTSSGQITGTPTAISSLTTYTVNVTDQASQSSSKTFTLKVDPVALTTTVAIATKTLIKNVAAASFIPVIASGGNGGTTYSISPSLPTGLSFNTTTGAITGTPTALSGATTYTVTATDNILQTSSKPFSLDVVDPPALTTTAITSTTLTQNQTVTPFIPVTGSGGYGTLTYAISPTLPAGLVFNTSTGQISGTPINYSAAASYTVTVSDQATQTSSKTFSLTVATPPLVATQAIASKVAIQSVAVNTFIPVTGSGGLTPYTYGITPGLPTGLLFNTSTGAITGTATVTSGATTYTVNITDTLAQTASNTFSLTVSAPPALTTTSVVPSSTFYRNIDTINVTPVTASGGYGTITFAISPTLPTGLSFNTSNGTITGTTSLLSTQVYTITATDSIDQTSSKTYSLTITDPPLVTTLVIASKTLTRSKTFTAFTPVTTTGGALPVTFSISPSLSGGLTFNVTNGEISGSPTPSVSQPATNYTVTVTDSLGVTSSKTFSLTVNEPTAVSTTLNTPTVDLTIDTAITSFVPVSASGGEGAITYSISPTLPSGVTFNNNTGAITGTPVLLSSAATYTVTATDSILQTSSKSFSLSVVPLPLVATVNNLSVIFVKYTSVTPVTPVSGSGGVAPLTYSISPALPAGLTYNTSTGAISGTPTAILAQTTYTVTITDSLSTIVSATFDLAVNDVPVPPLYAFASQSSVVVYVNDTVNIKPVDATGGVTPYTYSILPSVPAGLSFDPVSGYITGIPTATSAATTYTVTVTDQVPNSASATFSLAVQIYTPPPGTGASGISGYSGVSGYSGIGISGYSGVSGATGISGYSGVAGTIGASGYSGFSGLNGSGISNWIVETSDYTSSNGDRIIANTQAGSFTIYLPASPNVGDYIQITDGWDFAINNCIVNPNGSTIETLPDNVALDLKGVTFEFIYSGTTWQVTGTTGARGQSGYSGVSGYSGAALTPWTVITTDYYASNYDRLIANTQASSFTIYLPATPVAGDYIQITDGWDLAVNNCFVDPNGNTIEDLNDIVALDLSHVTYEFIYNSTTWEVTGTTGARGQSGYSGYSGSSAAPSVLTYIQNADRTGDNSTSAQGILGTTTGYSVTLAPNRYRYRLTMIVGKSSTDATTLGYALGGTASLLAHEYSVTSRSAVDFATNSPASIMTNRITSGFSTLDPITDSSPASAAVYVVYIDGYVDVGSSGTVIPLFNYISNTPTVSTIYAGTRIEMWDVGATGADTNITGWS